METRHKGRKDLTAEDRVGKQGRHGRKEGMEQRKEKEGMERTSSEDNTR